VILVQELKDYVICRFKLLSIGSAKSHLEQLLFVDFRHHNLAPSPKSIRADKGMQEEKA
jgi:hypothetical protein